MAPLRVINNKWLGGGGSKSVPGKGRRRKRGFKYLGTVVCMHESMEDEMRERPVKGRQLKGALGSHERKKCEHGAK